MLDSVDFSSDVISFKDRAFRALNLTGNDFEFLYHGRCMKDDRSLDQYGLKPGSVVDVIKTHAVKEVETESCDPEKVKRLQRGFAPVLANKSQRKTLEHILRSKDTIENLMASTPGLDRDVFALGLVQDLEMFILAAASDKDTLSKIIKLHPTFADAALQLIAAVGEGAKASHADSTASAAAYAIDRASDDEEAMEFDDVNPRVNPQQLPQGNADGGVPAVITADFFRQAMMMATGGPAVQPAYVVTQAHLDQLRDMGITDEAVARRALEQSGGDINLALEMIFGDGM